MEYFQCTFAVTYTGPVRVYFDDRPVVGRLSIACAAAGPLPWFGKLHSVISSNLSTAPIPFSGAAKAQRDKWAPGLMGKKHTKQTKLNKNNNKKGGSTHGLKKKKRTN